MDDVYVVDGDAHRPDFPMLPDVVAILLVQNLEVLQPAENAFHSPAVAEDVFVELLGFPYFVQQILLAESFDFRLGLCLSSPLNPVSQQLLARWEQLKKATLTDQNDFRSRSLRRPVPKNHLVIFEANNQQIAEGWFPKLEAVPGFAAAKI